MLIRVTNNLDNTAQYSYLSNSVAVGGTALPVKNVNGFTAQWAVQIGKTTEERAEILILENATPSGGTINTSGTARFPHPADTPVYSVKYDTIVFERSTTGTAGTAVVVGTVSITPDSEFTQYDDSTGASTYAYKTYYENSTTNDKSSESDWITPSGFSFFSKAKLIERAKEKLFSAGYLSSDDSQIGNWINEWMENMNNSAISVDKEYGLGTTNVTYGTSGLGTITATDFQEIKRIWITTDGVNNYRAGKMGLNDFDPNETFNSTHPYYYYMGDNVFGVKPVGSGGTAIIDYYKMRAVLSNDTDELPVVMQPYTTSFINYCVAEAYYNDSKTAEGDRYLSRAEAQRKEFVNMITPRSKTGVQMISILDPIDSDDGTWEVR